MTNVKLDRTVTTTRPDLKINFKKKPGAFILKNGVPVPDLTDDAMKLREKKNVNNEELEKPKQEII